MNQFYTAAKVTRPLSGISDVVKNPHNTIVCWCVECDGMTAEENAERIAEMFNTCYGYQNPTERKEKE